MLLDDDEVKENQDALTSLLEYADIPVKWQKAVLYAYTALVGTSGKLKTLFDRIPKELCNKNKR